MAVSDETRRSLDRDADGFCRAFETPVPMLSKTSEAPVVAVHDDGTIDVGYGGAVLTVRMTTACAGVAVGDTVLLTAYGQMLYATGILARDNGHYVGHYTLYRQADMPTRGIDLFTFGNVGLLVFDMEMSIPAGTFTYYATLPDGIRPCYPSDLGGVYGTLNGTVGIDPCALRAFVSKDGAVGLYRGNLSTTKIVGSMAFVIDAAANQLSENPLQ